ncbi:MAG: hypothetical protein LIO90_11700 [Bacteroidales bacterium]|nr:hypothetical protein [Bacteroidales bacterium]
MRKLVYTLAALLIIGIAACSDDHGTYGDFNVESQLSLGELVSVTTGTSYDLKVAREVDTNYVYYAALQDTLKDANGNFVTGDDGNLVITPDTVWYNSKITGHMYETEPLYCGSAADTFKLTIYSNARWYAPVPTNTKTVWVFNINSTLSGGGDSYTMFCVARNRATSRPTPALFYIYTQDSTIMWKIPIYQAGERDK